MCFAALIVLAKRYLSALTWQAGAVEQLPTAFVGLLQKDAKLNRPPVSVSQIDLQRSAFDDGPRAVGAEAVDVGVVVDAADLRGAAVRRAGLLDEV